MRGDVSDVIKEASVPLGEQQRFVAQVGKSLNVTFFGLGVTRTKPSYISCVSITNVCKTCIHHSSTTSCRLLLCGLRQWQHPVVVHVTRVMRSFAK